MTIKLYENKYKIETTRFCALDLADTTRNHLWLLCPSSPISH